MQNLKRQVAESIADALEAVRARCDGAHMLDGEGYSKFDRPDADALLDVRPELWTPEDLNLGKHLVRKYRRQLEEENFNVEDILNAGTTWSAKPSRAESRDRSAHGGSRAQSAANGVEDGDHPARGNTAGTDRTPLLPTPLLPPPETFDLPPKFSEWRHDQDKAVLRALDSPKRFVVLAMPTGSGKSLAYMAAAKLSGARTAFLTSTKALQSQLIDDFHTAGLVDVRGANNYECIESRPQPGELFKIVNCEHGFCKAGIKCKSQPTGCLYFDQVRSARRSELVVTNYTYYMVKQSQPEEEATLGAFDMLVLDEAHDAVDELCSHLSIEIPKYDVESLLAGNLLDADAPLVRWQEWARKLAVEAVGKFEHLRNELRLGLIEWRSGVRKMRAYEGLADSLARLGAAQEEWVCDIIRTGSQRHIVAKFDPVWPGRYAEGSLFRGVKKIILTSATIRPKTLELLGVKAEDIDFVDFPSVFPKERRPVIHVSTVRVDKNIDAGDRKLWVAKIDAIIRARTDRKGIIHTVSYERARYIFENSSFRDYMLMHETRTARDVVEVFKRGDPPLVLISPSMTTGWDFPYDACRYQIIAKIPFPDTRNKVMAQRTKEDKTYGHYIAMQTLVQACGRGMRASDDLCETIIVDDHARWFIPKWRNFAPRWFMESYQSVPMLPKPLELPAQVLTSSE